MCKGGFVTIYQNKYICWTNLPIIWKIQNLTNTCVFVKFNIFEGLPKVIVEFKFLALPPSLQVIIQQYNELCGGVEPGVDY